MTMDDGYVDIVEGGYDVAIRAGDLNDSKPGGEAVNQRP